MNFRRCSIWVCTPKLERFVKPQQTNLGVGVSSKMSDVMPDLSLTVVCCNGWGHHQSWKCLNLTRKAKLSELLHMNLHARQKCLTCRQPKNLKVYSQPNVPIRYVFGFHNTCMVCFMTTARCDPHPPHLQSHCCCGDGESRRHEGWMLDAGATNNQ